MDLNITSGKRCWRIKVKCQLLCLFHLKKGNTQHFREFREAIQGHINNPSLNRVEELRHNLSHVYQAALSLVPKRTKTPVGYNHTQPSCDGARGDLQQEKLWFIFLAPLNETFICMNVGTHLEYIWNTNHRL